MTPKEYLNQVKTINRNVELMSEKCISMRSLLYGRSVDFSSDAKCKTPRGNGTENALLNVMDYEKSVKSEITKLVSRRLQVERNIMENLDDPIVREIFERKYLLFQTWQEISERVNYSVQHLHRLHSANLHKFSAAAAN